MLLAASTSGPAGGSRVARRAGGSGVRSKKGSGRGAATQAGWSVFGRGNGATGKAQGGEAVQGAAFAAGGKGGGGGDAKGSASAGNLSAMLQARLQDPYGGPAPTDPGVRAGGDGAEASGDGSGLPERLSIRARLRMLNERFPGVLHDNDFVARCEIALGAKGFSGSNTIAITSLCRDEITTNLSRKLNEAFGTTFKLQGLGGLCSAGKTGLQAAFAHSPQDAFDGRERYVFFALTHIAIDSEGNVGAIRRQGRRGVSCACGALQAALNDFKKADELARDPAFREQLQPKSTLSLGGESCANGSDAFRDDVERAIYQQFYTPGSHAPDDPEYTMLQNRLLRKIDTQKIQELDLVAITKAAEEVITEDLQDLISKVVDPAKSDFAIVTGIQIHAWDAHGRDQIDMVWPANIYCSQSGEISLIDVHDVSPPTSRQMKLLFGHLDKYSRANLTPEVTW